MLKSDSVLRNTMLTVFDGQKEVTKRVGTDEYILADGYYMDFGMILVGNVSRSDMRREIAAMVYDIDPADAGQIVVKRYIRWKYGIDCPHYSISIIRDRGIDRNAVEYILARHRAEDIQFLDGWTGKGVIYRELRKAIAAFPGLPDDLAVVADPAGLTELCGTHEDILIASSCLNCTVCGLISRTVLREDLIGPGDFHGAVCYSELAPEDRTYEFIDAVERRFRANPEEEIRPAGRMSGTEAVRKVSEAYGITDPNYIKPGIGETTRVLLRRVPWKLLIDPDRKDSPELRHVLQLAREKGTDIEYMELGNYKCCGLIRKLSDV